ncbi:MAG: Crp/Fnr family transcriptional regulator, partial [Campylobacter sp.]|nr:Crp/Fnr family transcriptional regulator [Campylobacter sp.]
MLKEIPFFSSLNEHELTKLEEISVVKKYKKGEMLFLEGEEPQWLSILLKGRLKIYKTNPKGKEIFLHEIRPINMIAELVNFEEMRYPASSIFVSNGEILRINYHKFKALFIDNPTILFELLKSISDKLKRMNEIFIREIVLDSEEKVAKYICENFEA